MLLLDAMTVPLTLPFIVQCLVALSAVAGAWALVNSRLTKVETQVQVNTENIAKFALERKEHAVEMKEIKDLLASINNKLIRLETINELSAPDKPRH